MTMGGGGVKNPEKLMTSFMNAAQLQSVYYFLSPPHRVLTNTGDRYVGNWSQKSAKLPFLPASTLQALYYPPKQKLH